MRILCRKTYYLDHWFTKKEKIFIKGKYYTGKYSSAQPHLSPIYSEHTWPEYKVIENRVIFVDTDDNRNIWFSLDSSKPNYFYKYFLGEKEIRLNKLTRLKRVQNFVLLKRIHKFSIVLNIEKVKVWMQKVFN